MPNCKTCARSDVPDWDGNGHCITCTRDTVLGGTPEQRLEAKLYKLVDNADYYNHKEIKGEVDGILATVTAELRAMVPKKQMVQADGDLEDEYTGKRLKHELQENNINVGFNCAIDIMITNAKARGFDLSPTKEAKG